MRGRKGRSILIYVFRCAYQDRWAQPIFIPLLGMSDMKKPLSTPRPTEALKSLHAIYDIPQDGAADEDKKQGIIVGEDGVRFVLFCGVLNTRWQVGIY